MAITSPDFRDDHEMFTEGACHILAQHIKNLTGWNIYGFDDGNGNPEAHVFVIMVNGLCLDIDGVSTPEEMLERWEYEFILPFGDYNFTENNWEDWFDVKSCWERAFELAPDLIELATREAAQP